MSITVSAGLVPEDLRSDVLDVLALQISLEGSAIEGFDGALIDGQQVAPAVLAEQMLARTRRVDRLATIYKAIVDRAESREQVSEALRLLERDIEIRFSDGAVADVDAARATIETYDRLNGMIEGGEHSDGA